MELALDIIGVIGNVCVQSDGPVIRCSGKDLKALGVVRGFLDKSSDQDDAKNHQRRDGDSRADHGDMLKHVDTIQLADIFVQRQRFLKQE